MQVAGDAQPLLGGGEPGHLALGLAQLLGQQPGSAHAHEQQAQRDRLQPVDRDGGRVGADEQPAPGDDDEHAAEATAAGRGGRIIA